MYPHNSITFYDDFSYEKNGNLREFIDSTYIPALLESIQKQCILVLGWDGTMLKAIGKHGNEKVPFLGINFGHKGFLLNHPRWIFPEIPRFETRKYPLLELRNNGKIIGEAFNDIHLYSPEWKVISLNISNGFWKLNLRWDGMILSTPAGSTGHSHSHGWPILPHKSQNLVITPKGNMDPQSPKALDDEYIIQIRNTWRQYPLAINLDGEQKYISQPDEQIELEVQKSQKTVSLLIAKNHLQDWDNKVMQEQGFTI